jgi:glycosyltransferase involved in cell wall biosynthesis
LNILLVIADLGLGGAQQVVINLANEFVRQKNKVWIFDIYPELREKGMTKRMNKEVHLISHNYNDIKLDKKDKIVDFFLSKTSLNQTRNKILFKHHKKNLKTIISKNNINFVNSHVCWADYFVYKNLKNLHKKWIITLHASYNSLFSYSKNKYLKITKKTILSAKKIIYIHDDGLHFLEKLFETKFYNAKKIFNGVPNLLLNLNVNRQILGLSKKDFVVLCASRAIKEKGWFELCESVTLLKNENIKLIFAGEGIILDEIQKKYSSNDAIMFLGFQTNINDIINLSDLVCLPSYSEALPTILIESLFLKKPIIATNVGEVSNIVENINGKCGILIPKSKGERLVQNLSKAILNTYENRIEINKEVFDKAVIFFSVENMVSEYIKFFKK